MLRSGVLSSCANALGALSISILGAVACASAPATSARTATAGDTASVSGDAAAAARLFGLEDKIVLAYDTYEDGARVGMFVTEMRKQSPTEFDLVTAGRAKRVEVVADGVRRIDGSYLLKWPLAANATWPGESGTSVRVDAVDLRIEVPAGQFTGCVRTIEEGGEPSRRTMTVYCPGTGIAMLEVALASGGPAERAVLRSRGPIVDIGAAQQ